MGIERSPARDRAQNLYIESDGLISLTEIATQLNISAGTVRGWKAKDNWEASLSRLTLPVARPERKGAERKTSERKTASILIGGAPLGNQNASGHRGKGGSPERNKKAVRTHEYENFYFSDLSDEQKAFISNDDWFADQEFQQLNLIKTLTLREMEIRKDISELKGYANNLMIDTVVKKQDETIETVARNTMTQIAKLQDVLTRVGMQKQKAIDTLSRMANERRRLELSEATMNLRIEEFSLKKQLAEKIDLEIVDPYEGLTHDELKRLVQHYDSQTVQA